jgi:glycosyltransferase involved in cell wall biosynthesis
MMQYAFAARRLVKTHDFDAIFLNQWPLLHILALPRRYRARAVIDWCEVRNSLIFRFLQRLLPRLVAGNTAVSTQVAQLIRAASHSQVLVLPSGITTDRYRMDPVHRRRGLLYIGRLTKHKNLALLIDTFEELCRGGFEEPLIIAGNGPAFDAVRRRAQSSPYAAGFELLGWVGNDQKLDLLAGARLLILTSKREGFPRIVAEAMASGLPVVTARYPQNGAAGVVDEFQCGLCAAPTADDLASAARTVLSEWATWSVRAHRPSSRLDWSALSLRLETLLTETAMTARNAPAQERRKMACVSW